MFQMSKQIIYLNGQFIAADEGCISFQDRGFLLGDGCFETLRSYQGFPFALAKHLDRLKLGCSLLKIPLALSHHDIAKVIQILLTKNQLITADACVRITVTRGAARRDLSPHQPLRTTLLVTTEKLPTIAKTISAYCHPHIQVNESSPLREFKPVAYTDKIIAKLDAQEAGCDEAILFNRRREVVGTTCGNLFILKNNLILTPPLTSGCLPGTMRHLLINFLADYPIELIEHPFTLDILQQADEIFHTNSLREIQPISSINSPQRTLVSRFTLELYEHFKQYINKTIKNNKIYF
jgi:branched-subunit amino acid aminotransferase/4-amino-4-deoxychorismate lyase